MPTIGSRKLFLFVCIATFAAVGASNGQSEKSRVKGRPGVMTLAPPAAPQMCPVGHGPTPVRAATGYRRYLGRIEPSHVANR